MSFQGIDVSSWQNDIDWAAAKASGLVDFVYAKATQGVDETDFQYSDNREDTTLRKIPFGAYHYFVPSDNPIAQAQHFLNRACPKAGDLIPMVDVEQDDGMTAHDLVDSLGQFTDYVEKQIGKKLFIYTSLDFWNTSMRGSDAFCGHYLWIAEYNGDLEPTLPQGWFTWVLWQHTSRGTVPGITVPADVNILNPFMALRLLTL